MIERDDGEEKRRGSGEKRGGGEKRGRGGGGDGRKVKDRER